MCKTNQDIIGDKCVIDDNGKLAITDAEKRIAWKQHYEKLLNIEFPWPEANLPNIKPILGPAISLPQK